LSKGLTIPTIFKAIDRFSGPVRQMEKSVGKMSKNAEADLARLDRRMRNNAARMGKIGGKMMIAGAAIIAPLALGVREAIRFEDQLSDVGKTTGLSGSALEKFGDELLNIGKSSRTSITDLVAIGKIGGQLGVAENELVAFTKSADLFSIAMGDDFAGGTEEAIQQVGKLKNLFKETREIKIAESISRTGSAINDLSAKGAATSANITDFTLRLGALPDALKPSISDTIALGTSLEELGINSEIGSRSISKILGVAGTRIGKFSKQMGISAEETKKLLNNSPVEFLKTLATSFKGVKGDQLSVQLKTLGITSDGAKKTIGALSSSTERLTELQGLSSDAFKLNTSLAQEAATKNETMAAKMQMMKNQIQGLAIKVGRALMPVLIQLMKTITPMIERFSKWVSNNKELFGTIIKVVAVVGTLSLVIGAVLKVALPLMQAFRFIKIAIMALLGPIGLVIGGIGLLIGAYVLLTGGTQEVTAKQTVLNEVNNRANSIAAEQIASSMKLFIQLRTLAEGTGEYNNVLKQLDQLQPGIIEKFDLQKKSVEAINSAEKELIETIMRRAKIQATSEIFSEKFQTALEASLALKSGDNSADLGAAKSELVAVSELFFKQQGLDSGQANEATRKLIQDLDLTSGLTNQATIDEEARVKSLTVDESKKEETQRIIDAGIPSSNTQATVNIKIEGLPDGATVLQTAGEKGLKVNTSVSTTNGVASILDDIDNF